MNGVKPTFGSVCDGIGCGHLAFEREGFDCRWSAEIEPFPSAVLAYRFPEVRNMGDMMIARDLIETKQIAAPDVFIGGTPCQAFSIAGKRKGLDDERGNLSLEFCRIADGIDAVRRADGKDGCAVLWENVPGVLSDKGNAFGCFLGMLAGEDEAIEVEKWPSAGMVCGERRRVAWCVLDSQYFGVAQRRRRVFVVAVPNELVERLGERADPSEILAIGRCLRGDTPSRKDAGKETAGDAGKGAEGSHWDGSGVHPTLNQSAKGSGGIGASNQEIFSQRGGGLVGFRMASFGEHVEDGTASTMKQMDYKDATDLALYENHANDSRVTGPHEVSPMLTARMGTGGGNVPLVGPSAISFERRMVRTTGGQPQEDIVGCLRADQNSGDGAPCVAIADVIHGDKQCNGKGWKDDGSAYTLDTMATQGVCYPIDTMNALGRQNGAGRNCFGIGQNGDPCPTLSKAHSHAVCFGGDVARTLSARHDSSPCVDRGQDVIFASSSVRRITVTECERLQGLPDGWTQIPWRGKPASECPDGPRYKGIGNGQTVQVMQWLASRIRQALAGEETT